MDDLDINPMGSLVIRNFRHGNKRSSLKLEAELWDALHEIVGELKLSENKVLSALADYKETNNYEHGDGTFTSLVRVFIVNAIRKGISKLIHFRDMSGEDLSFFILAVFRG
jgi:predicted DNA-binding ribbon-helix-helix protein